MKQLISNDTANKHSAMHGITGNWYIFFFTIVAN